jgi:GNAT superfamily N-acetyltransferase
MKDDLAFRYAEEKDAGLILAFIKELAVYEKLSDQVRANEETLREWLFEKKTAEVLFAIVDGREIGYALYFHNFSTFLGKAGIYLEDIFIQPEYRGKGYGKRLFKQVAKTAAERGLGRLEWACLTWNQPSIDFYLSLGAQAMDEWTIYRLTEDAIRRLAEGE